MSSKLTFLLSVAITFIVTCNILLKKIFGRIRSVQIKTFVKKLIDFEKQIANFMSLGRGWKTSLQIKTQTVGRTSRSSAERFRYAAGYLENSKQYGIVICQCILIALVFFYLVNSKTRFDESPDRISEPKNLGRGNAS